MDEVPLQIKISDVNQHIVCSLCAGYFIEATTITECLHTYCKSCIVKYLQTSKNCPQCSNKIHETQPLFNLRADRTMQDIVYKLVPHLFESEEKRREEFYKSKGFKKQKKGVVEEKSGPKLSCILNNPNAHQYQYDEQICLCVDRYSPQLFSTDSGVYALPLLDKKFIRCSVRVLISHLKRMLKNKLCTPNNARIEMVCNDEKLSDEMSLKQVYLTIWSPKVLCAFSNDQICVKSLVSGTPMLIFYRLSHPG